jgi:hypothetical protein
VQAQLALLALLVLPALLAQKVMLVLPVLPALPVLLALPVLPALLVLLVKLQPLRLVQIATMTRPSSLVSKTPWKPTHMVPVRPTLKKAVTSLV